MSYLQQAVALASCEWFSLVRGSATIAELVDVPLFGGVARRLRSAGDLLAECFFYSIGRSFWLKFKGDRIPPKISTPHSPRRLPLRENRIESPGLLVVEGIC
jgi:hypothetical protein